MVAALELADGQNHVELARAQADERGSLLAQRGNQRSAEGKADDRADGNAGAGEQADGGGRPDGIDQDAGKAVAGGLGAEGLDLLARGVGLEQRVIDDGGQRLPIGESFGGKSRPSRRFRNQNPDRSSGWRWWRHGAMLLMMHRLRFQDSSQLKSQQVVRSAGSSGRRVYVAARGRGQMNRCKSAACETSCKPVVPMRTIVLSNYRLPQLAGLDTHGSRLGGCSGAMRQMSGRLR